MLFFPFEKEKAFVMLKKTGQNSNEFSRALCTQLVFPSGIIKKLFWLLHLIFRVFFREPPKQTKQNIPSKPGLSIEIPRWTSANYSFILPESSFFLQFLIHQTRFTSKWLWQSNFPEQIPEDRSREGRQPAACSHAHLPTPVVVRLLKAKQLRTSMIPSW